MKFFYLTVLLISATTLLFAQHSGNIIYGDNSSRQLRPAINHKVYLSDSTFILEANVLINVIADNYVATFGLADSAGTIKQANEKITKRILSFKAALDKLNISPDDVYIDMTTQNKFFDYNIKGKIAQQYIKGFEIKKNVIIKFKNISYLDKMLTEASRFQIYDLVKVDYIVTDLDKINRQLFELATKVIDQKKEEYIKVTNTKIKVASQIYAQELYSYYPTQLYKTYTSESTGTVNADYGVIRKDLRNDNTVYYDKINYSGYDTVINPAVTEPAVEFGIGLQIKFQIINAK